MSQLTQRNPMSAFLQTIELYKQAGYDQRLLQFRDGRTTREDGRYLSCHRFQPVHSCHSRASETGFRLHRSNTLRGIWKDWPYSRGCSLPTPLCFCHRRMCRWPSPSSYMQAPLRAAKPCREVPPPWRKRNYLNMKDVEIGRAHV